METTTSTGRTPALQWRECCRHLPESSPVLPLSAAQRRRAERAEERWIEQLTCEFERAEVRAAALRFLAEGRSLSVRTVATFFDVDAQIVIRALSLLPVEQNAVLSAQPPAAEPALIRAA